MDDKNSIKPRPFAALGVIIKEARLALRYSLLHAAVEAGIGQNHWHAYEKGTIMPSETTLKLIAKTVHLKVDDLIPFSQQLKQAQNVNN